MKLSVILIALFVSCLFFLQARADQDAEDNLEGRSIEDRQSSFSTIPGMSWLQEMTLGGPAHSRKKRFIQFPKGSSMEVKWSLNLPFDTYSDYKAKMQVALPIKIPFPEVLVASERADASAYHYVGYQDQQQNYEDNNEQDWYSRQRRAARNERSTLYSTLEGAFEKAGGHGRHCLLRSICDVAEAPFDQGILGEILNALLTASTAGRPENPEEEAEYNHYIEAELHGKLNGKCEQRYNKCKTSPFDLLPQIVQNLM